MGGDIDYMEAFSVLIRASLKIWNKKGTRVFDTI